MDIANAERGYSSLDFSDEYESNLSGIERALIRMGYRVGLLPHEGPLDNDAKRRNAAAAIAGVGLLGLVAVRDAVKTLRSRP